MSTSTKILNFIPPKMVDCSTSCTDLVENGDSASASTKTMDTNTGKQTRSSQTKKHHPALHESPRFPFMNQGDLVKRLLKFFSEEFIAEFSKAEAEKREENHSFKKPKVSFESRTGNDSERLESETEDSEVESDEDSSSENQNKHIQKDREMKKHRDQHPMKSKRQSETFKVREKDEKMKRQRSKSSDSALKNKSIHKANVSSSKEGCECHVRHERCIECEHVMKCPSSGDQPKTKWEKTYRPKKQCCEAESSTTDGEETSESQ